MLHDLLPHADLNRGFDAFPNHARNYGWTAEHNAHVWVFRKEDGDGNALDQDMTGSFVYPSTIPGGGALVRIAIEWSANETQGGVRWQFAYKVVRGENVASLDVDLDAGFTEAFGQIDQAAPGTVRFRRYVQQTLAKANLQKGDRVFWKLRRKGTVDTMPADALLFGLYLDDGL